MLLLSQSDLQMRTIQAIKTNKRAIISKCCGKSRLPNAVHIARVYTHTHTHTHTHTQPTYTYNSKQVDRIEKAGVRGSFFVKENKWLENEYIVC